MRLPANCGCWELPACSNAFPLLLSKGAGVSLCNLSMHSKNSKRLTQKTASEETLPSHALPRQPWRSPSIVPASREAGAGGTPVPTPRSVEGAGGQPVAPSKCGTEMGRATKGWQPQEPPPREKGRCCLPREETIPARRRGAAVLSGQRLSARFCPVPSPRLLAW